MAVRPVVFLITTYEATPRFDCDPDRLTPQQRFRGGLRIKGVRCAPGGYEHTWEGSGRARRTNGANVA